MKIESNNTTDVSTEIKIHIEKEDYTADLSKQLKGYGKNATIPGFRKGKVPFSVIQKMYGKSVLYEVVNKVLSEKLYEYIRTEKLNLLGEPLPQEDFPAINIETDETFDFAFDVALAPDLSEAFQLSKKDKVTLYSIAVTDEDITARLDNYKAQFGAQISVETADEDKDLIKVSIKELDGKAVKEDGIAVDEVFMSLDKIEDKTILKKVKGIAKGAVVHFKPYKAYKNETEVAGLLKISTEEVEAYKDTEFEFTVIDILRFQEAEVNQELFDKAYGPNTIATEEEFMNKIKDEMAGMYNMESDFKFMNMAKEMMVAKLKDLKFADSILKRWVLLSNEEMTEEEVNEHFPSMLEDLKWQLIKSKIAKDNNITVTEENLLDYAKKVAKVQFMQYGMTAVPEELMDNYALRILQDEKQIDKIQSSALEEKIIDTVKGLVKIDEKKVTREEFTKLVEADTEQ